MALQRLIATVTSSIAAFTTVPQERELVSEPSDVGELENRISALEQCCDLCQPSVRCWSCEKANIVLDGSVLYWQATASGMEFALQDLGSPSTTESKSTYKKPEFPWDWGFKLGADYTTPHDGWDIFLQWTSFHPKSEKRTTSVPSTSFGEAIIPLLSPDSSLPPATSASADWKLQLDWIDLELGREFYTSKWLTLRPFIGLRSAWVHQHMNIRYNNILVVSTVNNIHVGWKNNFWGMGLRMGLGLDWGLSCHWSLYSDLAASLLLGHFSNYATEDAWQLSNGALVPQGQASFQEKYRATRFVLDLDLGIRFRENFCSDRYFLLAQLGWEQHLFLNQNQMQKFSTTFNDIGRAIFVTNQGDLSTQGITLTIAFGF